MNTTTTTITTTATTATSIGFSHEKQIKEHAKTRNTQIYKHICLTISFCNAGRRFLENSVICSDELRYLQFWSRGHQQKSGL